MNAIYPNIERRKHKDLYPRVSHRGFDASGRAYWIGKGGVRGPLWWAREVSPAQDFKQFFGATLKEISEKLAATK